MCSSIGASKWPEEAVTGRVGAALFIARREATAATTLLYRGNTDAAHGGPGRRGGVAPSGDDDDSPVLACFSCGCGPNLR